MPGSAATGAARALDVQSGTIVGDAALRGWPGMTTIGSGDYAFRVAEGWEQLPAGWSHRDVARVAVDSRDRVYVFNRGEHPVIVYEPGGAFVTSWGEGVFANPHGITIGPDDRVYCTDAGDHTVRVFTLDGTLLQTLGSPGIASDTGIVDDYRSITHGGPPFNRPTNLAIAPNGDLYVSDGYGNARVHVFGPAGDHRFSWGEPGTGPGQFNLPHAIAVAADGRVLVADRENSRIQLFSPSGEYLDQWTNVVRPADLVIDPRGNVIVVELSVNLGAWGKQPPDPAAAPSRCTVLDPQGHVLTRFGTHEPCAPGSFFAPHGLCLDSRGDLYVGEVTWTAGGRQGAVPESCHTLQKLVRADPGG
jgi:DNA-binding beta-propeller fold protein YncE